MTMSSVLFVCTGNTCRSPMAEQILKAKIDQAGLSRRIAVSSAGLFANVGAEISAGAREVLARRGLDDGRAHTAVALQEDAVAKADVILTMTTAHKQSLLQRFSSAGDKTYTLLEYASAANGASTDRRARGGESGPEVDIADPFGSGDEVYEAVAQRIEAACGHVLARLAEELGNPDTLNYNGDGS